QHNLEDSPELMSVSHGQENSLRHAPAFHAGYVFRQVRTVFDEPVHATLEAWQAVQQSGFNRLHGEQRNDSHHRADANWALISVWKFQHVIEKSISLIPQTNFVRTAMVHGVGDVDEMLPELAGDIFIVRIVGSQLHGDGH